MSQQLILQKLERNFLQLRQDLEQLAATPTEAALQGDFSGFGFCGIWILWNWRFLDILCSIEGCLGKCSAALGTIDRQMRELSDMVQREPDMERRRELKT